GRGGGHGGLRGGADVDGVARLQDVLGDAAAVGEGPGGAAGVDEEQVIAADFDAAVVAGDVQVAQTGQGLVAAADRHGGRLGQRERLPLVWPGDHEQPTCHE